MRRVQALNKAMIWTELSLVITDHREMARIHAEYLGSDKSTDVISFAYPPEDGVTDTYTGEIMVNAEQAVDIGPSYEGVVYEFALYVAHGCHHLSGADDDTPARRRRMRAVETRWLQDAIAEGLLTELTLQPV